MNIAEIKILFIDGAGAHPCIAVHGARQRNYYFFRPAESEKFQRVYTDGATGEGIFPLSSAQDELTDILAGKQGVFDVRFRSTEEVQAERDTREAEKKRSEQAARDQAERMAKAEQDIAALQQQADAIRASAQEKAVAISKGIAEAVNTDALDDKAPPAKADPPASKPEPAPVKRKKSPIPSADTPKD